MTPFQARAQWDLWIADPTGSNVYHCRIANADYIRVPTVYEVNMFNTVARGKELEGTVKTIKKPTEENIRSEIGKLQMNHNKIGAQDLYVQSMTHSLVSGAESGSAFSGLDATLDVKQLVPEKVEVSDEEDEGEEGRHQRSGRLTIKRRLRKRRSRRRPLPRHQKKLHGLTWASTSSTKSVTWSLC